jgi:hypothetical protein
MREMRAEGWKTSSRTGFAKIEVEPLSVQFAEAAHKRAGERNIDFGAAMRELREEGWKP